MKIESGGEVVFGNNKNQSKSFSIASSSKAFKILSSSLYKNKIRAIVRELSCNCLDAHKLNGNTKPFHISVPTWLEQTFVIRDYGPGLSDDDVMNLYTTYFASTKDQSNDFIGALGLGSKSPFSYTDTFTVKSHFNGSVTQYSAMMVNGEPSIVKVSEKPSDALTGLEISIPVKANDIDKWVNEIKYVLHSFPKETYSLNSPNITIDSLSEDFYKNGYNVEQLNYNIQGMYSHSPVYAIYGNIAYPLNQVPNYRETLSWILNSTGGSNILFINFELGELDITPSREELSLDDNTLENINKKLTEINKISLEDEIVNLKKLRASVDSDYICYNIIYSAYSNSTLKSILPLDFVVEMKKEHKRINDAIEGVNNSLRNRLSNKGNKTPDLKAYDRTGFIGYHNKGRDISSDVRNILKQSGDFITHELNRYNRQSYTGTIGNIAFIIDDDISSHTLPKILKNISNYSDVFGENEHRAFVIIESEDDETYKKAKAIDSTIKFDLFYMDEIYKKAVLEKKVSNEEKRPTSPNGFLYKYNSGAGENLITEPLYLTSKEIKEYNGHIGFIYGDSVIELDKSIDLTKDSNQSAIKDTLILQSEISNELVEMVGGELLLIRPTHWKYASTVNDPIEVWKNNFKGAINDDNFSKISMDIFNVSSYEKSRNQVYGEIVDFINEKIKKDIVDVKFREYIIDHSRIVKCILQDDIIDKSNVKYKDRLNDLIDDITDEHKEKRDKFESDYPLICFFISKYNLFSNSHFEAAKQMLDYVKEKL